jgi:tRNA-uridine 2-sulfurtransferase
LSLIPWLLTTSYSLLFMKIIVGMSGGVDSSVAALLLKEKGYEVTGVTLRTFSGCRNPEDTCADQESIVAATGVAHKLGIAHMVVDVQNAFKKFVIDYFCSAYSSGRTPNPCVACNESVKFTSLLQCADELGAGKIATGHYARVREDHGRALLMRGVDERKDQAYFLSRLTQPVLKRTVFPLGEYRKSEVKHLAREHGLGAHERPESQEICFIPGDDYRAFLKEMCGTRIAGGDILDREGKVVGKHQGVEFYTVGQRGGLSLNSKTPRYVTSMDPVRRTVTVGGIDDLIKNEMRVSGVNWIAWDTPGGPFHALVKIRYNHPGVMSTVQPQPGGGALVVFDSPQKAVTPGQAAVFYSGDVVIGGGWID